MIVQEKEGLMMEEITEKMGGIIEELEEVDDDDVILPGFRFHPTDEELVGFYLRRKIQKKRLAISIIRQIDIYKYDPWDLSKLSTSGVGDKEWYFFCLRERKYRNSVRPNRVTVAGYWKATGVDKEILSPSSSGPRDLVIGLKKSLVYYIGKGGKGNKTDWMMHEFRLPWKSAVESEGDHNNSINSEEAHEAANWTICKIFKRNVNSNSTSTNKKESPNDSKSQTSNHNSPTPVDYPYSPIPTVTIDANGQDVVSQVNGQEEESQVNSQDIDVILDGAQLPFCDLDSSFTIPDGFYDMQWDFEYEIEKLLD